MGICKSACAAQSWSIQAHKMDVAEKARVPRLHQCHPFTTQSRTRSVKSSSCCLRPLTRSTATKSMGIPDDSDTKQRGVEHARALADCLGLGHATPRCRADPAGRVNQRAPVLSGHEQGARMGGCIMMAGKLSLHSTPSTSPTNVHSYHVRHNHPIHGPDRKCKWLTVSIDFGHEHREGGTRCRVAADVIGLLHESRAVPGLVSG